MNNNVIHVQNNLQRVRVNLRPAVFPDVQDAIKVFDTHEQVTEQVIWRVNVGTNKGIKKTIKTAGLPEWRIEWKKLPNSENGQDEQRALTFFLNSEKVDEVTISTTPVPGPQGLILKATGSAVFDNIMVIDAKHR